MTSREYEEYVARIFQCRGYETIVTPQSSDWGIDVIATKENEKIAIQAKMFGHTSRKVNRSVIMQLYGAMAYQDCSKAVLATDGEVLEDAVIVAKKLRIEILYTDGTFSTTKPSVTKQEMKVENIPIEMKSYPSFDEVWEKYIIPLKGKILFNSKGSNNILDVNWSEVT
ncbi:Predicted endonuclease distantly related to archaeal Holliday junction resolvase and Mrr-like restriction enzymes [Bacteroides heparinolyticus]|uniref:Predicted endonuclease distantly related to archaeal Holliday junction resolvase and Mrr-like restriction enzymes n=1 Tax=Prevotella heparinolytica TaxID=28113 RepID=A0A449I248_9BACE|nr:restriction endonuclease [Bacteroides heparinolyticus]VFB13489.1 Predicted endonuclease distantly related to archaeal Holliday junction resolvase and Mrr-like restriction enzymes [Bacteroides heparinolyticus]